MSRGHRAIFRKDNFRLTKLQNLKMTQSKESDDLLRFISLLQVQLILRIARPLHSSYSEKSAIHCVHFREKLEQKRFSAKLRIEPGTIRLPTVGCFNHSATGLVGK